MSRTKHVRCADCGQRLDQLVVSRRRGLCPACRSEMGPAAADKPPIRYQTVDGVRYRILPGIAPGSTLRYVMRGPNCVGMIRHDPDRGWLSMGTPGWHQRRADAIRAVAREVTS